MVKGRSELQMQLTTTTPPVKKAFQPSPRLRSNESPSGAFKRQSGLPLADGGALPRQAPQAWLKCK